MHLKREIKLKELADIIQVALEREHHFPINDIAEPEYASESDIIYLAHKKFSDQINQSKARAVLTSKDLVTLLNDKKIPLIAENLQESFIKLLDFFEDKELNDFRISKNSFIDISVKLGKNVSLKEVITIQKHSSIGDNTFIYPFVSIGRNVTLGKNCIIYPHVTIYNGVQIGDNVIIHSGVVIGCDGFGYMQKADTYVKIPQIGDVIIEDDVEIGANTTIDRSTIGSTKIGKGTKIDNLVQIAHNVEIGENCIIASQTGISGSTKIGNHCILAGQVGIADHAIIEDNIIVGAKTGISTRVVKSEEKMVFGIPGRPIMQAKRIEAIISKLPELYQEFNELKKKVEK